MVLTDNFRNGGDVVEGLSSWMSRGDVLLPTAWELPVVPMSTMEAFGDRWLSYWGLFAVNFFMG